MPIVALVLAVSLAATAQSQTLSARLQHTFNQSAVGREVAFTPDSQIVAAASADGLIKLWRIGDRKLVRTVNHPGGATSIDFSRDGQWLVSGGRGQGALATLWKQVAPERLVAKGKTVRLWRVSDGALQQVLTEHSDDVRFVAFSPDSRWIATSSEDKTARVWRILVR